MKFPEIASHLPLSVKRNFTRVLVAGAIAASPSTASAYTNEVDRDAKQFMGSIRDDMHKLKECSPRSVRTRTVRDLHISSVNRFGAGVSVIEKRGKPRFVEVNGSDGGYFAVNNWNRGNGTFLRVKSFQLTGGYFSHAANPAERLSLSLWRDVSETNKTVAKTVLEKPGCSTQV